MGVLENNTISVEDFVLLLEDRAFVDYFNIYQSLPIFGQHVVYSYIVREFTYEPPIRKRRHYIDRKEVVRWLCRERFPGFSKSCLYLEYLLCSKLRDVNINYNTSELGSASERSTFTRNILGNALGMQLFRDSLKGTAGEKCYRCWFDLERVRRMPDDEDRQRLIMYIKNVYLSDGAPFKLETCGKHVIFEGKLNFELIPDDDLQTELMEAVINGKRFYQVNIEDAYYNLQHLIISALKIYWVPRYLLHLVKTIPKKILTVLKSGTPYDTKALSEQRQMRCNFMFPKIYGSASTKSPTSPLKVIESHGEADLLSGISNSSSSSSSSDDSTEEDWDGDDEDVIKPSDLLKLCGGAKLEPAAEKDKTSPSSQESSTLDFGSADPRPPITNQRSTSPSIQTRSPSYTDIPRKLCIPPSLSTYISGRKRLNTGRRVNSKVMCALAADKLAGNPLQLFLCRQGHDREEKLLSFWTDVRQYLDTDEAHRDEFGQSIKQQLAHTIFTRYLTTESNEVFSETMKMSIFNSLSKREDSSLLCFAQDFVTGSLKDTWKAYMSTERKRFRHRVCGEKFFDRHILEYPSNMDASRAGPTFFFNTSNGVSPDILSSDYRPKSGSISADTRPWSRMSDCHPVALTDEQIMRAFEFTVILTEYGRHVMFSYQTSTIADIVDVIYSDLGSLQINKIPVERHEFLHNLMNKPKIDIKTIKVSRVVILDRPSVYFEGERPNRLALRRDGVLIERPVRPRTFMEVLNSPLHYEFFKRFMAGHKVPHPLAFWKNIEELRNIPAGRMRQNMMNNIFRKYFSKSVKQGQLLDCTDDIIRQIPTMEKVPISVLVCAQASVFRSMERKLYPKYLETFPSDLDSERPEYELSPSPILLEENKKPEKPKPRRIRKRKTLHLWQSFVSTIIEFLKSMKQPEEIQLLELYMKREVHKHTSRASKLKIDKTFPTTGSTNMFHTRVVLKNRLVIVDKLVMDLKFWCEVSKYVDQVDYIQRVSNISNENMQFLYCKARNIVNYYLVSEIPPRNQLNIPSDLAQSISATLDKDGPSRGLFHDAFILLFPLLYHYWRLYQKEWLVNHTAAELLASIEKEEKLKDRPSTPHKYEEVPDFLRIRASQMKITTQHHLPDDGMFVINFSLLDGCKIILPQSKLKAKADARRQSVMSRRTSVVAKTSTKNVKENSTTNIGANSPKKEKAKDKEKLKPKHSKKMDSVAEESGKSSASSQPRKSSSPKSPHTPSQDKTKTVEKMLENSNSPKRLQNMDDVVSAAVKNEIDIELFG